MSDSARIMTGRRAEYAEATRRAIVAAARSLFASTGYFATTVDDIAREARVAPATVYAVTGGKLQLLQGLIDEWSTAPRVGVLLDEILRMDDAGAVLRATVSAARDMRCEWADVIDIALGTEPHEKSVAESLAVSTERYRAGCRAVAERLDDLGAFRDGVDIGRAVDVMWFFLGYHGFSVLCEENRWSFDEAETWLHDELASALLAMRT